MRALSMKVKARPRPPRAARPAEGCKPAQIAMSALPPCVDGSELAKDFFHSSQLLGAPVCSASVKCGST